MSCADAASVDASFDRVLALQRVLQSDIQGIKDQLRNQIPRSMVIALSQAGATILQPQNQSFTYCLLHRIYPVVSSPGTLTVGSLGRVLTFPVNPGSPPIVFSDVEYIGLPFSSIDILQLTQTASGLITLLAIGEEVPAEGLW